MRNAACRRRERLFDISGLAHRLQIVDPLARHPSRTPSVPDQQTLNVVQFFLGVIAAAFAIAAVFYTRRNAWHQDAESREQIREKNRHRWEQVRAIGLLELPERVTRAILQAEQRVPEACRHLMVRTFNKVGGHKVGGIGLGAISGCVLLIVWFIAFRGGSLLLIYLVFSPLLL